MQLIMLKSKIHRAYITEANLHYVGSVTIDIELLEKSGIKQYEKVLVVDVDNGNRLETYAIEGKPGSGMICMNGAAARFVHPGDKVIIMSFCMMEPEEADTFKPTVVFVDKNNHITEIAHYEEHGEIKC